MDESSRVTLKGNHHPFAIARYDQGEVAPSLPMERMLLVLQRSPQQELELQRLIAEQQDRSSSNFQAWLSPEQFAERFAPAKANQQKAAAWLESHGLRVNRIARGGMVIEFAGTAGQVAATFHTAIHRYVVNRENHYANSEDPQLPTALSSTVAGISTLHNFEKRASLRILGTANRVASTSTWQPNFTFNGPFGPAHYLAPGDFSTIYNTSSLYKSGIDGTGQTIAIVGRSNINLSDVQIFRLAFGLPVNDPVIVLDGPDAGNSFGPDETEADLDVEWSGAIAPRAAIKLVVSESTNSTDGADLSAQYIVDNNLAPILSTSFGRCESDLGQTENAFYKSLWEQAAAEGITVIVSSGDSGAAGCDDPGSGPATKGPAVNGLASTPFNIAVGGTQFNENGNDSKYWATTSGADQSSALSYIPETVWNESCSDPNQCGFISLFASGGGASALYSKPPWQAGPGVPGDGKRDLPDISLNAAGLHDGYLVCQDGVCLTDGKGQLISAFVVGGTSASTPTFAGIMALVLQKTNRRQGQANFVLYPLAAAQNSANCNGSTAPQSQCVFNDVTQGNNTVPGQTGFSATAAYDLATGLGSVNAANLVNSWQNITFRPTNTTLQLSSMSFVHGQPVTATASVAPGSGAGTPSGDVALLTNGTGNVELGTLANGSVSAPITTLPGGSYSLSARYGGDATFAPSTSAGLGVSISPESSSLTFTTLGGFGLVPSTSTTYSNFFFLNAAVTGASKQGFATGTVSFSDTFNGSTQTLMTVPLNSQGIALVQETSLAVGSHTLNASYSGDASFSASSAGPITVTVTKGITQTLLLAPPGALPNTSVTLQAGVFPEGVGGPTGTVQFFTGATALGNPVPVQNFFATLTTTQLAKGANSVTATYSGDGNFNGSTSQPTVVFVGNPDFQIAVNPGNVIVSGSTPGTSVVLISPGSGLGYAGNISFGCSGLPAGLACSFSPTQLNVDGFSPASSTLSIAKGGTQAMMLPSFVKKSRSQTVSLLILSTACAFLCCCWLKITRRRGGFAVLCLCGLFALSGCGNSSAPTVTTNAPNTNSAVITVTATGTSGGAPVSHSVTLALSIQ